MSLHLIETNKLSKDFTRGGRSFKAVDDVDFTINEGEFVYIVGHSGTRPSPDEWI